MLPGAAFRALNPYPPLSAPFFHSLLSRQEGSLIEIEREGRLLAGAVLMGTSLEPLLASYCGADSAGAQRHLWGRPLPPGRVADLAFNFCVPGAGRELDRQLPVALYWHTLQAAIEQGFDLFTAGNDEPPKSGRYLGVLHFKQHWLTTTACFWSSAQRRFLRVPPAAFLAVRSCAVYPVLREQVPRLGYLVWDALDPQVRSLIGSDPHLGKELLVLDPAAAALLRAFCEERGLHAEIEVVGRPTGPGAAP